MKFILTPLALVLAGSVAAQDVSDDALAAMVQAIEEAGCVVTVANGDAILAETGLDEQSIFAVIAELHNDGMLALQDDGTARLTSEACQ